MTNPLLEDWTGPHALPPYDLIEEAHYLPAFEAAMEMHLGEVAAVAENGEPATFENTLAALERSGAALTKVAAVFFNKAGADTTPGIQEIEREIVPRLTAHRQAILMNGALWTRVKAVVAEADRLAPEEARLAEIYRRRFVRSGANLDDAGRARMAEIKGRLAALGTAFGQTVLKDEQDWTLTLGEGDLAGLPEAEVEQAREEGKRRGADGPVITLSRSSVEPFLARSARRDLRETAWRAWMGRGEAENWPRIAETLALRAELAALLGYESYAAFKLEDQMAKSPERVRALLEEVWQPALAQVTVEAAELAEIAAAEGLNGPVAAWDWRYLAEQRKAAAAARGEAGLDEEAVKAHLTLEGVIAAAFDVAGRLFGLSFEERTDLPRPHADARLWDVRLGDRLVGLFVGDYFARPSKRSGAWASALRAQQKLTEPQTPVILNTMNFARGTPTLLTLDDARTLFHEFGHALHGLLSDVTFPSLAGTAVARDFVELPSQLYEHWLTVPEVLERHARHWKTGAPMPAELIAAVGEAGRQGQGFRTVEYLGSAIVDLEMHEAASDGTDAADRDWAAFERTALAQIGMPEAIGMRHRSPHFQHVFAGDGYSAGYYSYMWSEVMDADAFNAFEEAGDPFHAETAKRLLDEVLSDGGRREPDVAYVSFRGAMPGTRALLEGRGLADAPA